jgi:tetratricopeptide (TPR) repeat protein
MNAFYRYRLGSALWQTGVFDEAILQLEVAVQLADSDAFYHFWLSDILSKRGRIIDAISEMQQATIFASSDSYYSFRLGLLYIMGGFFEESVEAFKRAIMLNPEDRSYHRVLAEAMRLCGNDYEAGLHETIAGNMDSFDYASLAAMKKGAGVTTNWD